MPSENPLEIPEILLLVVSYLTFKDVLRCLRVSKCWNDVFLPLRWRVVKAGYKEFSTSPHRLVCRAPGPFGPRAVDIRRHHHLIHDLTMVRNVKRLDTRCYPNLQKLAFEYAAYPHQKLYLDLTVFPSVFELKLTKVKLGEGFWLALSAHRHLRNLVLTEFMVNELDAPGFWRVCTNLESLTLDRVDITGEGIPSEVRIRQDEVGRLDLMLQHPNPENLALHSLDTLYSPNPVYPRLDSAIAHFGKLVHLDVKDCTKSISPVIRDVLCCCSRLEVLRAGYVLTKDIAKGGFWVCQLLRELTICFLFEESEQDLQPMVFEKLSTLTRLERLTFWYPKGQDHWGLSHLLEFRLDRGLGQLASLQQLTVIEFDDDDWYRWTELGMEEAEWIVGNWKNLRHIKGHIWYSIERSEVYPLLMSHRDL